MFKQEHKPGILVFINTKHVEGGGIFLPVHMVSPAEHEKGESRHVVDEHLPKVLKW